MPKAGTSPLFAPQLACLLFANTSSKILKLKCYSLAKSAMKYLATNIPTSLPNAAEFQKESVKRLDELYMYDVLRADRCISAHSLEARVPFADLDFVSYCMAIPPEMKMNTYNMGKYLLRKAFDGMNIVPDEILWREKAAFSDAVGHSMVDYLKTKQNLCIAMPM